MSKKNDDLMMNGKPEPVSFKTFLYNPRTSQILGRTPKSWIQIIVFYVVLYAFLAGFFALMMFVFMQTLENDRPKWTTEKSLIGNNPGMGFRPFPASPGVSLEFDKSDPKNVAAWTEAVDTFLKPYQNATILDQMVNCDYTTKPDEKNNKPCKFVMPSLTNCTKENNYGFASGNPCLFLKMNKMFDWAPMPHTYNEIQEGVPEMPAVLQKNIMELAKYDNGVTKSGLQIVENNVWVSCSNLDKESLNVTWTYDGYMQMGQPGQEEKFPLMGFPTYYYPYTMQENYLSPFIAVQFFDLPKGVELKMNCQLWAKGIEVNRQRRLGMTIIEMLSK